MNARDGATSGRRSQLLEALDGDAISGLVDAWQGRRVLVVGDLMLDEYRAGSVDRVSPEAPVPVVRVVDRQLALGGAGNVARNVAALGAHCTLVGAIGCDAEGDAFMAALEDAAIDSRGVFRSHSRPTTHKLRIVARDRQLLRIDREQTDPFSAADVASVRATCEVALESCDVVVLQDYDKGLFSAETAASIVALARARGVPIVADPKHALERFRGADLVKPNEDEALRLGASIGASEEVDCALLEKLRGEIGGGEIVVTRGGAGMTALDRDGVCFDVPTERLEVFDVQGAGDTSIAALALAKVARASLAEACIVANAAASVAIEKIGTAAIDAAELRVRLPRAIAAAKAPAEAPEERS